MEQTGTPSTELLTTLLSNPALLRTVTSLLSGLGTASAKAEEGEASHDTAPPSLPPLDGIAQMLSGLMKSTAKAETDTKGEEGAPEGSDAIPNESTTEESVSVANFAAGYRNESHEKPREALRNDLLLALKPFLSKERCAAVDSIIRLSALGKLLGQIH